MDATGQEIRDVIEAPTEEEAQATIRQMGYFVTRISIKKSRGAAGAAGEKSGKKRRGGFAIGGAGSRVLTAFTRQLSILQDAGLPILRSLRILEEQYVLVSLLQDVIDRGLNVAIGTETGIAPLADCSVVVAPYAVDGEPAGTIGVLGPTRMNYPQALAAVAVVSQRLGNRLSEG